MTISWRIVYVSIEKVSNQQTVALGAGGIIANRLDDAHTLLFCSDSNLLPIIRQKTAIKLDDWIKKNGWTTKLFHPKMPKHLEFSQSKGGQTDPLVYDSLDII